MTVLTLRNHPAQKSTFGLYLLILFVFIFLLCFTSCQPKAKNNTEGTNEMVKDSVKDESIMSLNVEKIVDNMKPLTNAIFLDNKDMWFTEQAGKIWVVKNGNLEKEPLLDLSSKILKLNNGYEERGLLGITLHPDFKTNKKFYTFYSRSSKEKGVNHTGVIAEYQLSEGGAFNPESGRIILTVDEPDGNHNGGCLQFGPDGYLYVSLGDGGGQHDKHGTIGNGQDMSTLLGKILRIDVNTPNGYKVPKDNPFVGKDNVRPEIWAYGFRNPYRVSFDRKTGELFVGDVGQDLWEEVDIIQKGANYGWRIVEGTHCHNAENTPDSSCNTAGITMPIAEYSHKEGISITGGFVYRGSQIPELEGKYVFADWSGPVFCLENIGKKWERKKITLSNIPPNLKITGIGEDTQGELYFLTNPDTGLGKSEAGIYKLSKQ